MRAAIQLFSAFPDRACWPLPEEGYSYRIPTCTRAWISARAALVPNAAIRLFAIEDTEKTAALLPVIRHNDWLHELPRMFEPSDLVWSSVDSLAALAAMFARQPLPLRLERVPLDSPSIHALQRAFRWRGIVITREAMPTPTIELSGCVSNPEACLTRRRQSDLRRAERHAIQLGQVKFEFHAPRSEIDLKALMRETLEVEACSWKVEAGTALTTDQSQGAFFETFTRVAMQEGILRIALLRIDGHAIAMQIACEWQQRYWLLKISHDQAFSSCSPGQLLIWHTIREAARNGLLSYEFMGIMAPWTKHWTKHHRRYLCVQAIPFSLRTFKMMAKRLIKEIATILRKFVS